MSYHWPAYSNAGFMDSGHVTWDAPPPQLPVGAYEAPVPHVYEQPQIPQPTEWGLSSSTNFFKMPLYHNELYNPLRPLVSSQDPIQHKTVHPCVGVPTGCVAGSPTSGGHVSRDEYPRIQMSSQEACYIPFHSSPTSSPFSRISPRLSPTPSPFSRIPPRLSPTPPPFSRITPRLSPTPPPGFNHASPPAPFHQTTGRETNYKCLNRDVHQSPPPLPPPPHLFYTADPFHDPVMEPLSQRQEFQGKQHRGKRVRRGGKKNKVGIMSLRSVAMVTRHRCHGNHIPN